jgi:hypothetical protein
MLPILRPPTPKGYSNNSIRDVYYHHLILMRGVSNRHRLLIAVSLIDTAYLIWVIHPYSPFYTNKICVVVLILHQS